ncbi:MAG: zinc ribbon domain-containing protein [Lachnospiraceae bacterium]|nr:zinc ribbon domain-containing protein [Lachnospiraceae bacterium]
MYCRECGKEISDSSKYCRWCGAKTDFGLDMEESESFQADEEQMDNDYDIDEAPVKSKKKLFAAVIIIAACVAALLIAVHFIHPGFPGNGSEKNKSQTEKESEERSDGSETSESVEDIREDEKAKDDHGQARALEILEKFESIPEEEIEPFTEEEINTFEKADEGITALTDDYVDEEGYIEPEELEEFLDVIEDYVSDLRKNGVVAAYERDDTSVSILFESGISYYIAAPIRGLLNSGSDETRVLALETFSGSDYGMFDLDRNFLEKDLKTIARKVGEASDEYSFNADNDYREVEKVSVQYLKELDGFKLLLWHGHGGYFTMNGTILMTNQEYDKNNHSLDTDMKLGRITLAKAHDYFWESQKYAITPKFVDKYFPKIDNSIVYLGACDSCAHSDFAESLLRRGARCVIGYTKTVAGTYELNCRTQLFERLRNGESIPDAIKNTTDSMVAEPLNYIAGGVLYAYYADGLQPSDQYLEPEDNKEEHKKESEQPLAIPDPEDLMAGQEVTFGHYYRDYEYPNDKMPVEWVVLDAHDGKALLTSKYALINLQYLDYNGTCTWETSYLREWLNNEFYNEAFTDAEKEIIRLTDLTNEDNPRFGTDGGNTTSDHVFVLSADEADQYYSSDMQRRAKGTSWAYHNGLALVSPDTGDYSSVVFNGVYGNLPDFNCMYWLRTPGADSGAAAFVDEKGTVQLGGNWVYYYPKADPKVMSNLPEIGVRPVLWLEKEAAGPDHTGGGGALSAVQDSDIIEAYREVLESSYRGTVEAPWYCFGFVDNDEIPELLLSEGNYHAAAVKVYTYKEGTVQEIGIYGSDGNMSYYPYEDLIFTYWIGQGHYINTYYHTDGSVIHSLHSADTPTGPDPTPVKQVDDIDVSADEYDSLSEQIRAAYPTEQMTTVGYSYNMYAYPDSSGFEELERYLEDKARLKAALEDETGLAACELICADYDKDGTREAFAVTGEPEDNGDGALYYSNARVWFVSSDGQVTEMTAPEEGQRLRMINTETALFYTFERHAYGSSSVSYIYGVRNGKPYEPELSGACEMFRRADPSDTTEEEPVVTGPFAYTKSVFVMGQGHTYQTHFCRYNSSAGEFES